MAIFEQGWSAERWGFFKEFLNEAVAIIHKAANDLKGSCVLVIDLVKVAVVEGEDLRAGIAEQNGGVGRDEELGIFVTSQGVVDEDKE